MNKQLIAGIFLLIAGLSISFYLQSRNNNSPIGRVACTMEAKICPDGSAVGRSGPNCEFAKCPDVSPTSVDNSKNTGTLTGTVTLGPVCPVERIPPDPNCAPKPYDVFVDIVHAGYSSVFKTVESGANGKFATTLPAGTYELHLRNKNNGILPRCEVVNIKVVNGKTTDTPITCDTGIR